MFLVNFLFLFRCPLDSYLPALDSSNLLHFTVLSFCSSPCFVITFPVLARSSRIVKHGVTSLLTLYFFLPGVINNVSFLRAALCSYQNRGLTDNFVFCRLSFGDVLNPPTGYTLFYLTFIVGPQLLLPKVGLYLVSKNVLLYTPVKCFLEKMLF